MGVTEYNGGGYGGGGGGGGDRFRNGGGRGGRGRGGSRGGAPRPGGGMSDYKSSTGHSVHMRGLPFTAGEKVSLARENKRMLYTRYSGSIVSTAAHLARTISSQYSA